MLKSNLRKVIAKRANLLENLFESVFTDVVDGEGETINMGVTYKLPTFEMYATHALENLSAPAWDNFCFFCQIRPWADQPCKKCAPELNPGAPDFLRIVIIQKMGT